MQGLTEYIIEIKQAFKDKIKTDSGLELHLDARHSPTLASNKNGKVVSTPLLSETSIQVGDDVIIDPTAVFNRRYRGIDEDSNFLVDKEKGWYRLTPELILLYRKDSDDKWKANGNNVFVEPIEKASETPKSSLIIMPEETKGYVEGEAILKFPNKSLEDEGLIEDDYLYIRKERDIEYKLDGKTYWWIRDVDVLGYKPRYVGGCDPYEFSDN